MSRGLGDVYKRQGILSCIKYLEILNDERPFELHNKITMTARTIMTEAGFNILGEFGTHFDIQRGDDHRFFIIPINATEEYFTVLKEQLK